MNEVVRLSDATSSEATAWFFENVDAVLMVVRDGRAALISPGLTTLLGWSESEALQRTIWDFVYADDIPLVRDSIRKIMAVGHGVYEHRVLMKSGAHLWMRVRVKQSADGSSMSVMQNITEERRQDAERAEIANANALLNKASGVRLWRYDPAGDEYELDPDFSRPFGQLDPSLRLPGGGLRQRIDPLDLDAFTAALTRGVKTGETAVVDYRGKGVDGHWRHLRSAWTGSRRLASGQHQLLGLTQDLTELMTERDRAVAGQRAAVAGNLAKTEFLSNISHELRTPMNGLLGSLHLAKAAANDERSGLIDQAVLSGEALAELLGDIVEFAAGETGGLDVQLAPISTRQLLNNAIDLNAGNAKAKGLWLDLTNPMDATVVLDGAKVRHILRVLIGNALKFTTVGGVDVSAALTGVDANCKLTIRVIDTGPGIAASHVPHLFDRFHQVDGSTTRRHGGAGLGLASAQQLAKLMGGAISCESVLGHGSTFRLVVPVQALAPTSQAEAPRDPARAVRVLAVDDNDTNLKLVCALLSAFGADTETARDGVEAVAAAARGGFDLILMDIQMPIMDGVEATRRIRAMLGAAGQTPIVALTANVLAEQRATYDLAGMNGCLAKPLSPGALHAILAQINPVDARAA